MNEETQQTTEGTMTEDQAKRWDAMFERLERGEEVCYAKRGKYGITLDGLFQYAPEGEFKWEQPEAGDWDAINIGNGWSLVAYAVNIGRTAEGIRWIEIMSVDTDGDWDTVDYWQEGDDHLDDVLDYIGQMSYMHFYRWGAYWLDCAETGDDPLKQVLSGHRNNIENWVEFCLKSTEECLKYLEM